MTAVVRAHKDRATSRAASKAKASSSRLKLKRKRPNHGVLHRLRRTDSADPSATVYTDDAFSLDRRFFIPNPHESVKRQPFPSSYRDSGAHQAEWRVLDGRMLKRWEGTQGIYHKISGVPLKHLPALRHRKFGLRRRQQHCQ